MIKNTKKTIPEKVSCALCGEEDVYSGIVFKGFCVCEECVEYMSSNEIPEFDVSDPQTTDTLNTRNGNEAPEDPYCTHTVCDSNNDTHTLKTSYSFRVDDRSDIDVSTIQDGACSASCGAHNCISAQKKCPQR